MPSFLRFTLPKIITSIQPIQFPFQILIFSDLFINQFLCPYHPFSYEFINQPIIKPHTNWWFITPVIIIVVILGYCLCSSFLFFITTNKRENSYEVWRNYFSNKSMLETINKYSSSGKLKNFWTWELKRYYGKLSEFVHNSLINVYGYSFTLPHNDVEPHCLNVCSHYVTRSDNILDETINLIWVLTKVFRFFMDDTNYSGFVVKLLGDDNDEYVKNAKNGCYFADYYFLRLSKKVIRIKFRVIANNLLVINFSIDDFSTVYTIFNCKKWK